MFKEYDFLKALAIALSKNKIRYVILRNYYTLPESCGGSDIDLWVKYDDYNRFLTVLKDTAWSYDGVLVSILPHKTCPRLIYQAPGWGVQFDVHIGVAQHRGVPYMENSIIEEHILEHNGIKVLAPGIDGLISFLKEVLNNKKCKEAYCVQAADLIDFLSKEECDQYLKAFSTTAREKMVDVLRRRDFSKESIKQLGIYCSNELQTTGSKIKYRLGQISKLLRVFKQPGYTLAFLGTDGSGKSFIIDSVTPILNGGFHNGIRYEHMRPNHLPSLAVAMGKKKTEDEDHHVCSDPHASKPSGLVGSIVRLSYYWLDYTWGYFRKVFKDKSVSTHVWIFDRYYYDYLVDQRRARLNMPQWIIKLCGWFVPTPDLTICLGGDPKKIFARKPETSLEEVTRQTKVLQEFARTHKKAVWVDTTTTPEESINAAMSAIVDMMSKRFAKSKR